MRVAAVFLRHQKLILLQFPRVHVRQGQRPLAFHSHKTVPVILCIAKRCQLVLWRGNERQTDSPPARKSHLLMLFGAVASQFERLHTSRGEINSHLEHASGLRRETEGREEEGALGARSARRRQRIYLIGRYFPCDAT
jgi:hypothetical protein